VTVTLNISTFRSSSVNLDTSKLKEHTGKLTSFRPVKITLVLTFNEEEEKGHSCLKI
jgi:hypothetical protein